VPDDFYPPPDVLALDAPDGALEYLDEPPAIEAVLPEGQRPERPPWTPADLGAAEWAMAHVHHLTAEIDAVQHQARLWHMAIDEWAHNVQRAPAWRLQRFTEALERWGQAERDRDPSKRTLALPSGKVAATVPRSGTVVIRDHDAAVRWLAGQPWGEDAIKRPAPEVKISVVRQHIKPEDVTEVDPTTGEPTGLTLEPPGPARYTVKPG
jgi:hypothetical protein